MKYFKHMSNMRDDIKIKRLIAKYGLEGYGLYNLIVETIASNVEDGSPMPELQETCEDLAEFYNGNTAKINEMVSFMINQGLLEISEINGRIMCQKIYKFFEQSQTRSESIRKLIKNYKVIHKLSTIDVDNSCHDMSGQIVTNSEEENRREENRREENRKEVVREEKKRFKRPSYEEVKKYCEDNKFVIDSKFFYDYYNDNDWYDANGKKVKNWKGKARTWNNKQNQTLTTKKTVKDYYPEL